MDERPDTVVVLGGGANLGAVQVGMLDVLHEHDIRPDILVGASIGAVNGVVYAASPDRAGIEQLRSHWLSTQAEQVFKGRSVQRLWRAVTGKDALYTADGLVELLGTLCPVQRLEELAIPLHVAMVDATRGTLVYRSRGPAVAALMASSAIPGVFPPHRDSTGVYLDGGTTTPIPLSRAVELAPRRIIVCDASGDTTPNIDNAFSALLAGYRAARRRVTELEIEAARKTSHVVHISVPGLSRIGRDDFGRAAELIDAGAEAARAAATDFEQPKRRLRRR